MVNLEIIHQFVNRVVRFFALVAFGLVVSDSNADVRFKPKAMPKDPRYFGKHPTGTTGFGYGELNGAKPLDEPWHVR